MTLHDARLALTWPLQSLQVFRILFSQRSSLLLMRRLCLLLSTISVSMLLATLGLIPSPSSKPQSAQWWTAMDAEMSGLDCLSAFTWVLLSAVPAGVCILSCKWVYTIKPEKYKARIVVCGDQQDLDDKVATYSPTLKSITRQLLLALALYLGWSLWQMNVCNAF